MTRRYNNYLTDGTAALKANRCVSHGGEVKVVCTRGAKPAVVVDDEYIADHTLTYRQYAANSANDIADAIVYGSAKGQASACLSRSQFALVGFATAMLSLIFVVM